jgi:hypothetical protein
MKPTSEQNAKSFYDARLRSALGEPVGASKIEIARLEESLRVSLPSGYARFLEWMGNDSDGVFRGTHIFINHVVENTRYLEEQLDAGEILWSATGRSVCIYSHQGYALAWFDLPVDNEEAPECHFYFEGHPVRRIDFWGFIFNELRTLARPRAEHR